MQRKTETSASKIYGCTKCNLHKTRRKIVIGRGHIPADLLIIGEGPGNAEDATGEAFMGPAGNLLDRMLLDAECFGSEELQTPSFFMTNTVLCHPTDSVAGDNRKPKATEIHACMKNVLYIYELVQPKVTILCGETAQKFYAGEVPDPLMMYHPSFIERTGSIGSPYYSRCLRVLNTAYKKVLYAQGIRKKGSTV